MSLRRMSFYVFSVFLVIASSAILSSAQTSQWVVGRNVNMVSGKQLPGGDPYLQRQNEPSIAVSTRNPQHLLAGANDYRTIDLPFQDGIPSFQFENVNAPVADAWLGVFKSYDGGQSWSSTLLPGYPQDTTLTGMNSPLKAYGTAADPVVRAGTNGIFYYAGIAFNRVDRGAGVLFVARYLDLNNQENGDTIKYDGVRILAQGNAGQFIDKPWMAVDVPREGAREVMLTGHDVPVSCGNVYVAYSTFVGKADAVSTRSKIMVTRSTDCGQTWSSGVKISESQHIDQGATIGIDPDGTIYVAWRRFTHMLQPNAILVAKSTNGGQTFTQPVVVNTMSASLPPVANGPFDQRTTPNSFRTNSYPTIAVDGNHHVYLAWSDRDANGRALIVATSSADGINWPPSPPVPVDMGGSGQQFMPSFAFASGKLIMTWYDQRMDKCLDIHIAGLIEDMPLGCRHAIDVRMAQINPLSLQNPELTVDNSKQVSRYLFKLGDDAGNVLDSEGYAILTQLEYNFPNLILFQKGTVPFLGDYIDLASTNIDPTQAPVFHAVWTDNRDVKWNPSSNFSGPFAPNSSQTGFPNGNCATGDNTGVLNQNIYTATISQGFIAGSPGNTKPLFLEGSPKDTHGNPIPRAFTVFVKNLGDIDKQYTLQIFPSTGVTASFLQYFEIPPGDIFPNVIDQITVWVAPHSSISRPVYVYPPDSADNKEPVTVLVTEVSTTLTQIVALNPDPKNPPISDPYDDYPTGAPNIRGSEVHSPNIRGISVKNITEKNLWNPNIRGTDPSNPNIRGADVVNSDTANPNIRGDALNPNIRGNDILDPNIRGESISEITWEVQNTGNTTTTYNFYTAVSYVPPAQGEEVQFQLLIYRVYLTPSANGCDLEEEEHHELITNIYDPNILGSSISAGDIGNATFYLKPNEKALITLLAIDPKPNNQTFSFGNTVEEAEQKVVAQVTSLPSNTEDLENGNYNPPVAQSGTFPVLVSPLQGAVLDNGCQSAPPNGSIEWDFSWTPVPDAQAYELYVKHTESNIPVIDVTDLTSTSFHSSEPGDYITEANRYGWTWKVRARVNGVWTAWSQERSFDVVPPNDCALIECAPSGGGDQIDRGFYVPNYPGSTLSEVTLYFSSDVAGSYTFRLTALDSSYDGTVIGSDTATVMLSGDTNVNSPAIFSLRAPVDPGTLIAFKIELVSGPAGSISQFYSVGSCGFDWGCSTPCSAIETEDTTPPLSTFRRRGIGVRITGSGATGTTPLLSVTFDGDTLTQPPPAPASIVFDPPGTGTALVQSDANGITTKPLVLTLNMGSSMYGSVDYSFGSVNSGIVVVEATVSFSDWVSGYFLQTAVSGPAAVVTRLWMSSDGRITGYGSTQIGTYQPNTPFRVRMMIDMDAKLWRAAIDSAMNGFDDDPLSAWQQFVNTGITSVGAVNASLGKMGLYPPIVSVAYDNIFIWRQQ